MKNKLATLLLTGCTIISLSSCNNKAPEFKFEETENYYYYENYAYGTYKKDPERQVLDLALPKSNMNPGLILYIHGGGWVQGDKGTYVNDVKERYTSLGYAVAGINYHYIDKNFHNNEIMNDITNALTSIKSISSEKGYNITKTLVHGGSAGGHLSLQYSYTMQEQAPIKPVAVAALVPPTNLLDNHYFTYTRYLSYYKDWLTKLANHSFDFNNKSDAEQYLREVSPLYYVNANTIPTIIAYGAQDDLIPPANSVDLDAKLTEYGVTHELIEFPNSWHDLGSDPDVLQYYNQVFNNYLATYLS